MNYYWFNTKEILQKAKERYSKGKKSCRILFTKQRTCQKKKKTRLKSITKKDIENWFSIKKKL